MSIFVQPGILLLPPLILGGQYRLFIPGSEWERFNAERSAVPCWKCGRVRGGVSTVPKGDIDRIVEIVPLNSPSCDFCWAPEEPSPGSFAVRWKKREWWCEPSVRRFMVPISLPWDGQEV